VSVIFAAYALHERRCPVRHRRSQPCSGCELTHFAVRAEFAVPPTATTREALLLARRAARAQAAKVAVAIDRSDA
jgi:hypothetical protein